MVSAIFQTLSFHCATSVNSFGLIFWMKFLFGYYRVHNLSAVLDWHLGPIILVVNFLSVIAGFMLFLAVFHYLPEENTLGFLLSCQLRNSTFQIQYQSTCSVFLNTFIFMPFFFLWFSLTHSKYDKQKTVIHA